MGKDTGASNAQGTPSNPVKSALWYSSVVTVLVSLIVQWYRGENYYSIWRSRRPSFVKAMNQYVDANAFYGMCYHGQPLIDHRASYCSHSHGSLARMILDYVRHNILFWKKEKHDVVRLYDGITLSIIMPFHNHGDMTCQSLNELAQDSLQFETEFILVSDASKDTELKKVRRCAERNYVKLSHEYRLLENRVSIGYGPSCNVGAKHAQGTFLFFANNDMFVGNGAIHAMIHTIQTYPDSGIVGPLFLGHDMIIQELGGVIYKDASAANAYRDHGTIPKSLFMAHEVDYISAACLMIRKADFDALKGFDEAYGRGYYEDTDLAMAIRKLGKKVILQPFATVFHQEGGTFGSDTPEKQALMNHNRKLFFTKWERELNVYTAPGTPPLDSRERYMVNPILWADQYFITPSHDSGSQRSEQILKYLQNIGFQITYLPMTTVASEEVMPSIARMRFHGIRILTDKKSAICDEQTNQCQFNVIFIARPFTYRDIEHDLDECCKGVPIVYDTVDLHFLREARQYIETLDIEKTLDTDELIKIVECGKYKAPIGIEGCLEFDHDLPKITNEKLNQIRWLHSLMEMEMKSVRKSDITLVVSEEEKNVLSKMGIPTSKLKILSNIYRDEDIHNALQHMLKTDRSRKTDAIFVGNFQHIPNIGAVEKLIEITKLVSRSYPDFKMHIVGSHGLPSHLQSRIKAVENIIFHGWLSDQDLDQLYEEVICAFIPLSAGAGVKGKVASAYLHGVPVIGSKIALEGMGLQDGLDYILAEEDKEYLKAYSHLRLNQSYRGDLALHGIQVIEDRLSFSSAAKNLSKVLRKIGYYMPEDEHEA